MDIVTGGPEEQATTLRIFKDSLRTTVVNTATKRFFGLLALAGDPEVLYAASLVMQQGGNPADLPTMIRTYGQVLNDKNAGNLGSKKQWIKIMQIANDQKQQLKAMRLGEKAQMQDARKLEPH